MGYRGVSRRHSHHRRDESEIYTTAAPKGHDQTEQKYDSSTSPPKESSRSTRGDSLNKRRNNLEEQLLHELFYFGYGADARAVLDSAATVTVTIQYTLLRIQKLVSMVYCNFFTLTNGV